MSRRDGWVIGAAAAVGAAVLGFRAGQLAAKAEARMAREVSRPATVEGPRPAPAPEPTQDSRSFSEWEQGVPPRDG